VSVDISFFEADFWSITMPYIDDVTSIPGNFPGGIPPAETAKYAGMRPTTHFAIVTGDNPDMQRVLEQQDQFVQSELAKMTSPLDEKARAYKIKELQDEFQKPMTKQARIEQEGLMEALKKHGIPMVFLVEDKGHLENGNYEYFTDQIFATDLGQYCDVNRQLIFIPSCFKNKQRQGEERLAIAQAKNLGAEIYPLLTANGEHLIFEGGDVRQMVGKKLFFIGQGHRSDPATSMAVSKVTGYYVMPIKLLQEQFYHLDCCFLPLPNDAAVIYEGEYELIPEGKPVLDINGWPCIKSGTETMAPESRALIRAVYSPEKLVLITKAEALAFATNAAVLQANNGRFKMFVNGNRAAIISDESTGIGSQLISLTQEHIADIRRITDNQMDVIEVPYTVMHGSGGSVRCTVQEVACTTAALQPHKNSSNSKCFFSDRLLENGIFAVSNGIKRKPSVSASVSDTILHVPCPGRRSTE